MEKKNGAVKNTIIKDSGKRQNFSTGSRRDTNTEKVRPDLIPSFCEFFEGAHYAMGSVKYGDRNWELGQPIMRYYESLKRHMLLWALGDISENHLNGITWNNKAIQYTLIMIDYGHLPKELDDRPVYMLPDNPIGRDLIEHFNADIKELIKRVEEMHKGKDAGNEEHSGKNN